MKQVNRGTAYILWCLWLFGLGGVQRLYTGNIGTGLLYLLTWGLFGIGQVIDLVLIPNMVYKRNMYLRGLASVSNTPIQRLLKAAKENNGLLSIAQATMYTELEPQEVKQLLQESEKNGLAEIVNDPNTEAIRYRFDI